MKACIKGEKHRNQQDLDAGETEMRMVPENTRIPRLRLESDPSLKPPILAFRILNKMVIMV